MAFIVQGLIVYLVPQKVGKKKRNDELNKRRPSNAHRPHSVENTGKMHMNLSRIYISLSTLPSCCCRSEIPRSYFKYHRACHAILCQNNRVLSDGRHKWKKDGSGNRKTNFSASKKKQEHRRNPAFQNSSEWFFYNIKLSDSTPWLSKILRLWQCLLIQSLPWNILTMYLVIRRAQLLRPTHLKLVSKEP